MNKTSTSLNKVFRRLFVSKPSSLQFSTSASQVAIEIELQSSSPAANSKPRHTVQKPKYEKINVFDAVDIVKNSTWAKFDETFDIAVRLGVDPRKPNQAIKGVATLPSGTGKTVRVAVFAQGADAQAALDAGANVVGAEDLVARIQAGDIAFDRAIATPELMPLVGKIGKILGPRGLMPNPKMGTVTKDVVSAIKAAKAGSVQFRVDKAGIIHAGIGKVSFSAQAILDNIRSFMVAVGDGKPEGYKGKYLIGVSLSSTMGPGVGVDISYVDPNNPKFMKHPSLIGAK